MCERAYVAATLVSLNIASRSSAIVSRLLRGRMYLRGAETEWWAGGAWAWMSKRGGREHGLRERESER